MRAAAFSVGFQVGFEPVKVDVANTESLQTRSVYARPGGPCLLEGSGGMPPPPPENFEVLYSQRCIFLHSEALNGQFESC